MKRSLNTCIVDETIEIGMFGCDLLDERRDGRDIANVESLVSGSAYFFGYEG